jgi:hypothetical protein
MKRRRLLALALIAALVGIASWFLRQQPNQEIPPALLPSKNPEPANGPPPIVPSIDEVELTPATPPAPLPEIFSSLERAWMAQIDPALRDRLKIEAWLERPGLISGRLRFDGLRMEPASLKWAESQPGAWALSDASLPSLPKAKMPEFPRYDERKGREVIEHELEARHCNDVQIFFTEAYWEAEQQKNWTPSLLYRVDARCPGGLGSIRERWTLRVDDFSVARKRPATRPLFGP